VSLFEAGQKAGFCIETVEKASMAITSSVKVFRLDQLQTQNVITAISNMIIKGRVSSEELVRQLGESVPTALSAMADTLDLSKYDTLVEVQEGNVVVTEDLISDFAVHLRNNNLMVDRTGGSA